LHRHQYTNALFITAADPNPSDWVETSDNNIASALVKEIEQFDLNGFAESRLQSRSSWSLLGGRLALCFYLKGNNY
jgi:hypothetical protein